jgi:hypothetical protein
LPVPRQISRAVIGAAATGPLRLRDGVGGLRMGDGSCREKASGSSRCQHFATRNGIHDFVSFGSRL